jgi:hypothetical protein
LSADEPTGEKGTDMADHEDAHQREDSDEREDDEEDPIFRHPLVHLDMGLIDACTQIVPKTSLTTWTADGWVELPGYFGFLYAAEDDEMVIAKRPDTLAIRGASGLISVEIEGWHGYLGSYGMGGPGFFGLLLPPRAGTAGAYREYLVFAAWGANQYIFLDGKVLDTSPSYSDQYDSWLAGSAEGQAALDTALIGARIEAATLTQDALRLKLMREGRATLLEFVRNDPRLAPMGDDEPRKPAYTEGVIADHLVFQPEHAVLWV